MCLKPCPTPLISWLAQRSEVRGYVDTLVVLLTFTAVRYTEWRVEIFVSRPSCVGLSLWLSFDETMNSPGKDKALPTFAGGSDIIAVVWSLFVKQVRRVLKVQLHQSKTTGRHPRTIHKKCLDKRVCHIQIVPVGFFAKSADSRFYSSCGSIPGSFTRWPWFLALGQV